jgi:hypothetical protein
VRFVVVGLHDEFDVELFRRVVRSYGANATSGFGGLILAARGDSP